MDRYVVGGVSVVCLVGRDVAPSPERPGDTPRSLRLVLVSGARCGRSRAPRRHAGAPMQLARRRTPAPGQRIDPTALRRSRRVDTTSPTSPLWNTTRDATLDATSSCGRTPPPAKAQSIACHSAGTVGTKSKSRCSADVSTSRRACTRYSYSQSVSPRSSAKRPAWTIVSTCPKGLRRTSSQSARIAASEPAGSSAATAEQSSHTRSASTSTAESLHEHRSGVRPGCPLVARAPSGRSVRVRRLCDEAVRPSTALPGRRGPRPA